MAHCNLQNEIKQNKMKICSLWNENLYFAEWKSVFHEMMKIFISQNIDFHFIPFCFVLFHKLQ